jgi:hypothetical protein
LQKPGRRQINVERRNPSRNEPPPDDPNVAIARVTGKYVRHSIKLCEQPCLSSSAARKITRMANGERTYQRTVAGFAASKDGKSGLSLPFRRILSLLDGGTHFTVIRAGMGTCHDEQLVGWLDQLETLGFIESANAPADCGLDFTSIATTAS